MYLRQKPKIMLKSLAVAAAAMIFILLTPAISQAASTSGSCKNASPSGLSRCLQQSPIVERMQQIVNFLSAIAGIVIVGTLMVGGIQYIIAGDNPQEVTKARQRIINGLIALAALLLLFAFLQWIIPGGVFKR